MILDRIDRLARYAAILPGAEAVCRALLVQDPSAIPYEVREKRYALRSDAARRFEVHAHTIDLMACFSGGEVIHITDPKDLTPAEPLPQGQDGLKLDGRPQGLAVRLLPGWFFAILPEEAHCVAGQDGVHEAVYKWVVKIPV